MPLFRSTPVPHRVDATIRRKLFLGFHCALMLLGMSGLGHAADVPASPTTSEQGSPPDTIPEDTIGDVEDADTPVGDEPEAGYTRENPHKAKPKSLRVRRRVKPKYPDEVRGMGITNSRCKVRVRFDERGVPYDTSVSGCHSIFHEPATHAVSRWRWRPHKEDGVRVPVQTFIVVLFVDNYPYDPRT